MKRSFYPLDNEPVKIFKFFSAGVTAVFMLLLIMPEPLGNAQTTARKTMIEFSVTYGSIFVYLLIPGLERLLKQFYMPPLLLAACIIPIAIINAKYRELGALGIPINSLDDTMTVTMLLLFPLIITAWQYKFSIVFLFYVVLGCLDPLLIILVNESFTPEVYGAFNTSLVRILSLCAVGFMITELRNRQRREKAALKDANRKLEEYASASERLAASRERNRIARDLHDTLAHTLSGLAIQLEAVSTVVPENNKQLETMIYKAQSTVRDGLGETRRALSALRATPLDDMGLLMALQRLADNAVDRDNIEMQTQLVPESSKWSKNLEEATYRIAQEALENVIRHAHASRVSVDLQGDSRKLVLTIKDDGLGFHPDKIRNEGRFGLKGMQERAESIGGNFSIRSESSKGTTVVFRWEAAKNDTRHYL